MVHFWSGLCLGFFVLIADLTNSFRFALNIRSVIGMDVDTVWFMCPIIGLLSGGTSFLSPSQPGRGVVQHLERGSTPPYYWQALEQALLSITCT